MPFPFHRGCGWQESFPLYYTLTLSLSSVCTAPLHSLLAVGTLLLPAPGEAPKSVSFPEDKTVPSLCLLCAARERRARSHQRLGSASLPPAPVRALPAPGRWGAPLGCGLRRAPGAGPAAQGAPAEERARAGASTGAALPHRERVPKFPSVMEVVTKDTALSVPLGRWPN